jgi:hypothetical protein
VGSRDVVIREFFIGGDIGADAAIVYIDGLVNSKIVNEDVLGPLLFAARADDERDKENGVVANLKKTLISVERSRRSIS